MPGESPAVILFDQNEVELAVKDGVAIPANTPALLLAGKNPANLAKYIRMATDGTVRMDPTGTTEQPITAASLPLPAGAATEAKQSTLIGHVDEVEGKLTAIDTILSNIRDTLGIKKITDALPVGDNVIGRVKLTDGTYVVSVLDDVESELKRLAITGKVSVVPAPTPATATEVVVAAYVPLEFTPNNPQTEAHSIPTGKTFYLLQAEYGAEDDPSDKGSRVELAYYDGTTEHIVDLLYVTGDTSYIQYPETSKSLDGTTMVGGTGKEFRIKRQHFGGAAKELYAVVRGYEK